MAHSWLVVVGILSIWVLWGCEDQAEMNAKKLYDAAQIYSENREYEKAIELLQRINIDYSETETATRAAQEIQQLQDLYFMLIDNQRSKMSQKFMRIALALDNYKLRYLSYPLTTKDLEKLPSDLIPEFADEWGNLILYRAYASEEADPAEPDNYALASCGEGGLPGGSGSSQDYFYQNGKEVAQLSLP